MSADRLRKAVLDALAEVAPDVDASRLDAAEPFREQFDFDSMDTLNLVTALHRSLGVEIPEVDYAQLLSLDGAVRYLEKRIGDF